MVLHIKPHYLIELMLCFAPKWITLYIPSPHTPIQARPEPKSNCRVNLESWFHCSLHFTRGKEREWESRGQNLGDKEPRREIENQILIFFFGPAGLWRHAFSAHLWLAAQFSICWELKADYLPEIQTFQGSFESLLVVVTTWAVSAPDNHIMRLSGTEVAPSPHPTIWSGEQ